MPIYEYACPSCGHDFEAILRFSDPTPPCPRCQAAPEKKISRSAFHLKGAGWYKDLYSGKDNTKPGTAEAPDAKSADTPSTPATGESATAASAPTAPAAPATPAAPAAPASAT